MHSDQVTRFLLGELPQSEMERLNALFASDEGFQQRVRIVEDDLIECFVKGQLTGDQLIRFRRYFLASPERRERVKISQGFLDDLIVIHDESWLKRQWRALNLHPSFLRFREAGQSFWERAGLPLRAVTFGVALLLFAICLNLFSEWIRNKRQAAEALTASAEAQQANQELQQQLEQGQAESQQLQEQLNQTRENINQIPPPVTQVNQPAPAKPAEALMSAFALRPASRGAEGVPELVVQPNTDDIVLQLELGRDDRASYRAELRTQPDGLRLWQSGTLKPRVRDYGKAVEVRLPAALLKSRAYTLKVFGANAAGAAEEAISYSFRINNQ
jgi:hypothetical protein